LCSDTARPDGWVHRYPVTVQFDEVDQYGIVHHTRYLVYCERARVDLMGQLGMQPDNPEVEGMGLIVVSIQMKFLESARFLDEVVVEQGCARAGVSRVELVYRILRGETVLAKADLVLAFVGPDGRPCRAPDSVRAGLQTLGVPQ